jgi:hypothetical protein
VRTHVLRPTWHFVAPEDLRWLLALTKGRVHQASAYQYRQLELDERVRAKARGVLEAALTGGRSMTREELGGPLEAAGIAATGLRLTYFVMDAELEGVLCSGARRGKRHTYALLEERLPPAASRTRADALAELGRRYVEGHGPAQVGDLAWWSGLTVADARLALESATPALMREQVGERTFWVAATPATRTPGPPVLHLLPNYDELLVAFRDRSDAFDPGLPPPLRAAEVILGHVVVRDGLVIGRFRRRDGERAIELGLELGVPLADTEQRALREAIRRLEAFVGRPVEVTGLD